MKSFLHFLLNKDLKLSKSAKILEKLSFFLRNLKFSFSAPSLKKYAAFSLFFLSWAAFEASPLESRGGGHRGGAIRGGGRGGGRGRGGGFRGGQRSFGGGSRSFSRGRSMGGRNFGRKGGSFVRPVGRSGGLGQRTFSGGYSAVNSPSSRHGISGHGHNHHKGGRNGSRNIIYNNSYYNGGGWGWGLGGFGLGLGMGMWPFFDYGVYNNYPYGYPYESYYGYPY